MSTTTKPIYFQDMVPGSKYKIVTRSQKEIKYLFVTFTGEICERDEYVMYSYNDGPERIKVTTYKVIVDNEEKTELWVNEIWNRLVYY